MDRNGYHRFRIGAGARYRPRSLTIQGDASSASYFWAAAAVTAGSVTTENICPESNGQGDLAFLPPPREDGLPHRTVPGPGHRARGRLDRYRSGHGRHAGYGAYPGGNSPLLPRNNDHSECGPPSGEGERSPPRGDDPVAPHGSPGVMSGRTGSSSTGTGAFTGPRWILTTITGWP